MSFVLWLALLYAVYFLFINRNNIGPFFYHLGTSINSFISICRMPQKDVDSFMESYTLFNEESVSNENKHKIANYYFVLNQLCAIGEVEKMYIPPLIDTEGGIIKNQKLYEQKMMRDIDAAEGQHVLELGCGRGRVAAHVATITGASVSALNIEPSQIANGLEYARRFGLAEKLNLKQGDFNDPLPFSDNAFDGAYEVQALSYVKGGDLERVFREVYRVLKPGAKFCILDWALLPAFHADDAEHADLLRRVKPLLGAVYSPTPEKFLTSLKAAGFNVVFEQIPCLGGFQYPLVQSAVYYFQIMRALVWLLVKVNVLPKHLNVLMDRFNAEGATLAEGDRRKLWTTVYQVVAQKPAAASSS